MQIQTGEASLPWASALALPGGGQSGESNEVLSLPRLKHHIGKVDDTYSTQEDHTLHVRGLGTAVLASRRGTRCQENAPPNACTMYWL